MLRELGVTTRTQWIFIHHVVSGSGILSDTSSLHLAKPSSRTPEHFHQPRHITVNMGTDSNNIGDGWISIPLNGGTSSQPLPPAYSHSHTAAANHFATPQYDAETSPATAAAASRRPLTSRYTLPTALPSVIEMQDLGAGASTCEPSASTAQTSTPQTSSPSNTSAILPTPATEPEKEHGAAYRTASFVLKTVGIAIGIVAVGALIYGLTYGIYELFVLIFFR
jgi:hypothetical protein